MIENIFLFPFRLLWNIIVTGLIITGFVLWFGFIFGSVIGVILILIFAPYYLHLVLYLQIIIGIDEYNALAKRYDNLTGKYNNLQNKRVADLDNLRRNKEIHINNLNNRYHKMNDNYNNLKNEHNRLDNAYNNLRNKCLK